MESPSITCYAQREKRKSQRVIEAFAAGCGGAVVQLPQRALPRAGDVAFYGVRPAWSHLWDQAKHEGRTWYYLDNAWFDVTREQCFRIGVNATQSWSREPSDGKRIDALGLRPKPWQKGGKHIVVCRQSEEYMAHVAGFYGGAMGWHKQVLEVLRARTDRPIVVRVKGADKPLAEDLKGAWLLVTHSSAAAVEALMAGVPVIVTDEGCAAAEFGTPFNEVEAPLRDPGREAWAARLADSQWTLDELRSGVAWKALRREHAAA